MPTETLTKMAHDVWLLCGAPEGVDEAVILAALEAAVAQRDKEWTIALGTTLNHRGEGVTPEWMANSYAQHYREMERQHCEAVA